MLCIWAGAVLISAWSDGDISLSWRHSVTHDWWREEWRVDATGLLLQAAEVSGPGAGLEIPENATPIKGGWRYHPTLPPLSQLVLAASGKTSGGWHLCHAEICTVLGAAEGEALLLERQDHCDQNENAAP